MDDANNETDLELNYNSEASTGDKRKRDGKLRSKVWQHFTKIIKEDGRCDKCQCNHCNKLFTCSSRSGTTHLLRHITDGICPAFRKDRDRTVTISSYGKAGHNQKIALLPWKFDQSSPHQQCMDVKVLAEDEEYGDQSQSQTTLPSRGKLPQQSLLKSHKGEAWMNEFRSCVGKLVELANGKIPVGSIASCGPGPGSGPDYSVSAAVKHLNEMEDIPQSSEMYLDAFEILQDSGERESFICLPPEPRRRWLQRMLHRRHPLRYTSNLG